MRLRLGPLLVTTAALQVAGCPSPPVYELLSCSDALPCPDPLWCVAGLCSTVASGPAPSVFAQGCDSDGGLSFSGDSDAGVTENLTQSSGFELGASAVAAHRGACGIAFTDDDGTKVNGDGALMRFEWNTPPAPADTFLRTWLKQVQSNGSDNVHLLQLNHFEVGTVIAELVIDSGALWLAGFDTGTGYPFEVVPASSPNPLDGQWHLVELALLNGATDSGVRELRVDGQAAVRQTAHWASPNFVCNGASLGAPWSDSGAFRGTVYFGDVRVSHSAPASTLTLAPAEVNAAVGACLEVQLQLSDSFVLQPAPAAEDLRFALEASSGSATFHADATCTTRIHGLVVSRGQSGARFYIRPGASGTVSMNLAHVDLLGAPTLTVHAQ
jgi:hypothetical protein